MTVTGGDDADAANDEVTLTNSATGGDYDTTTADLAVTIEDDDAALVFDPSASLSVPEGATATYTVALAALPAGNVSVAVTGHESSDVTVSGAPMTFTTLTWATAQTVTVTGGDDTDITDDEVTLTHTATGGDYDGTTADLAVTVTDDDATLVIVSSLSVPEGTSVTYTVALGAQPTGNVSVAVTGHAGTDVTVSGVPLTFTTGDWSTRRP